MGRKGVSKRKPKGSKSFSKNKGQESNPDKSPSAQDLVKGREAPLNNGNAVSHNSENKKYKKGK